MTKESQAIAAHATALTSQGYCIAYVALYGSQNYNIATAASDVDSKAIVMPSLTHFVNSGRVKPRVMQSLGGQCDIKDIREMFANYLKSNINFLETLYTDTFYTGAGYELLVNELRGNADIIANYSKRSVMKACVGMATQKCGKLYNFREGTPERDIKHGYVVKELCHLMRLTYFARTFAKGVPFADCLVPTKEQREFLFSIKNYEIPQDKADYLAAKTLADNVILLDNAPIMKEPDNSAAKTWLWELCNYFVTARGVEVFSKVDLDDAWMEVDLIGERYENSLPCE